MTGVIFTCRFYPPLVSYYFGFPFQLYMKTCSDLIKTQSPFFFFFFFLIFCFHSMKVWNFEAIDAADSVDDTGLLEVEPMNELQVGRNVSLNFMSKVHDNGQPIWYAQVREHSKRALKYTQPCGETQNERSNA